MTLSLRLLPYQLEFAAAVRDARSVHAVRHGAVLELETRGGLIGRGEAAPLPGRSQETLSLSLDALRALPLAALPTDQELAGSGWLSAIEAASGLLPPALSAAKHALEGALLDLSGQLQGIPAPLMLASVLGQQLPVAPLPVAALVDARELASALLQAQSGLGAGARALKLKIAGDEAEEAITSRVAAVRSECAASVGLRLDANQSLSVARARSLAARLAVIDARLEYIEEPVPAAELAQLRGLPIALALDETLLDPALDLERALASGVRVLVIKPMLLGLLGAVRWMQRGRAHGLEIALSHTFDGPVAMATARALALGNGAAALAHGLARHAALAAWPAPLPLHVTAANLCCWAGAGLGLDAERA